MVPNKFPALQIEGALDRRGEGLYDKMNGVGAHEVVIEGPEPRPGAGRPAGRAPGGGADGLPRAHAWTCTATGASATCWSSRTTAPGPAPRSSTPTPSSSPRPSSRKNLMEELEGARRYYELKERCVFCDIIQQDTAEHNGRRVVARTTASSPSSPSPRASRSRPGSCRGATTRRSRSCRTPTSTGTSPASSRTRWAGSTARSTGRPTTSCIHTAPVSEGDLDYYHWHLEIMPKLDARGRLRDRLGLPHQPDAARGRRPVPAGDRGRGLTARPGPPLTHTSERS